MCGGRPRALRRCRGRCFITQPPPFVLWREGAPAKRLRATRRRLFVIAHRTPAARGRGRGGLTCRAGPPGRRTPPPPPPDAQAVNTEARPHMHPERPFGLCGPGHRIPPPCAPHPPPPQLPVICGEPPDPCIFKVLRDATGDSRNAPQTRNKNLTRFATPPPPAHTAGVGV